MKLLLASLMVMGTVASSGVAMADENAAPKNMQESYWGGYGWHHRPHWGYGWGHRRFCWRHPWACRHHHYGWNATDAQ